MGLLVNLLAPIVGTDLSLSAALGPLYFPHSNTPPIVLNCLFIAFGVVLFWVQIREFPDPTGPALMFTEPEFFILFFLLRLVIVVAFNCVWADIRDPEGIMGIRRCVLWRYVGERLCWGRPTGYGKTMPLEP